ncbi:RNA-directed DNA polymerase [Candidatus Saccharibacteria bacterium]|nr:RNA-directed DNA polymerase [Candidatus Saccharibacteria bacterium]
MAHTRTRRIYDEALQYEKIYTAWNTVYHTCKNQQGKFEFALFAHARVMKIMDELKTRAYLPNRYRCFMIFEPKPRLVMSQSIRDKVVNHFVAKEYLIPLLEKTLIDANVATREGRGSAYANKMLRRYFSQMMAERPKAKIYALKVDVSKYFYSIDHKILFEKLERKIKDRDVIEILRRIVDETDKSYVNNAIDRFNKWYGTDIPHYEQGKGLSIGAMTSQFLAIFYLNSVDHYIKEVLKCKYFIRYMDDFLILSHDKEWLREVKEEIANKLAELKLTVNPKSAIYNCDGGGFAFLGYRYYVDRCGRIRIVCLAKTVRRIRRRLGFLALHNPGKRVRSYESYRGFFLYGCPVRKIEAWV